MTAHTPMGYDGMSVRVFGGVHPIKLNKSVPTPALE